MPIDTAARHSWTSAGKKRMSRKGVAVVWEECSLIAQWQFLTEGAVPPEQPVAALVAEDAVMEKFCISTSNSFINDLME